MTVIYWRVTGIQVNQDVEIGAGITLDIMHDYGQSDTASVDFTNDDTMEDISARCAAEVATRTAAEFPLVTVTDIRQVTF